MAIAANFVNHHFLFGPSGYAVAGFVKERIPILDGL
jgi:hypothetical protein